MWILNATWDVSTPISHGRSAWSRLPGPILDLVRTGILGGTFDPIHIAHLHAGETALHQAELDRVLFIPAGDPWQKADRDLSPAATRLEMTRLAVEGLEGFDVDDREVSRDGATYTADTLESFPDDEELFLILGADAALGLETWDRHELVTQRATILVVPRPGTDSMAVADTLPDAVFLDMAVLEISSTDIRNLTRDGQPCRWLLHGAVHYYIAENGLYPDRRQAPRD